MLKINIIEELKKELSNSDYKNYIQKLTYKKASSSDELIVFEAPNKFLANYIKTKFTSIIQNICFNLLATKPSVEIKLIGEKRRSKKDILNEKISSNIPENTILNQSYTFDSFVVGSSNQMAFNASKAVSDKLGILYNPLFIYGGTGLGKTHLLQAIGNKAIENHQTVIYVTIEQFMNDFTFSIKTNKMENFRSK